MKTAKFVLLTAVFLAAFTQADAQNKKSAFHAGFFPPLDTHGSAAKEYVNTVSVNLLVGVSAGERAFALSGLGNTVLGNAAGVSLSGLWNYTGGNKRGVDLAGLGNVTAGDAKGIALAGLGNYTGGNGRGVSLAGLANIVRGVRYNGVQAAGLFNMADGFKGVQAAGLFNVSGDMKGVQAAGLFGSADWVKGVQGNGLLGIAERMKGFQGSGLVNIASETKGVQAAGLLNIAGRMKGVQLAGLVNIADRAKGVQAAALLNIARSSTCPIGLVNIIGDGEMSVAVVYRETGSVTAEFRSGSRVTYGILGAGYNHRADGKETFATVAGIGAHINCTRWLRIKNELTAEAIGGFTDDRRTLRAGYGLLPEFVIARRVGIFGGPSINFMYADRGSTDMLPSGHLWKGGVRSGTGQLYIGYTVALELIF